MLGGPEVARTGRGMNSGRGVLGEGENAQGYGDMREEEQVISG